MFWYIYMGALVFLFGMMMGSFYNVCIHRIPNSLSVITPPSHCENCGHLLKPLDLIPIMSWILLGRKCRYCKAPVSARYALVELLTGVLFVLLYLKFQLTGQFLLYLVFGSILLLVAFIDIDHRIIPDRFIVMGLILGVISLVIPAISLLSNGTLPSDSVNESVFVQIVSAIPWKEALFGALIGGGSLLLVDLLGRIFYKKEGMGFGDVKLMGMAGLFLGVQRTVVSLLVAIWAAAIVGIIVLRIRKEKTDHYMPFGPFLAAGCVLSIFFGKELIRWYLSFI